MSGIHAERMIRALRRLGWDVERTSKHFILADAAGRRVVVPMHKGTALKPGTARAILKSAGISEDEFFAV
jgi:predicted RNA binding protein YcfA (HicA-like mRNA interferase family)